LDEAGGAELEDAQQEIADRATAAQTIPEGAGQLHRAVRPVPAPTVTVLIVILYVPTFLLGAWVYIKYRTYEQIAKLHRRAELSIFGGDL
jgi:hypothetical protein